MFGEYGEEVVGTMMNALTVGDNQMSDVTDWNLQVDTFLGVSLMGGFLSGVKTVGLFVLPDILHVRSWKRQTGKGLKN